MTVPHKFLYHPGELHAVKLDDNTVAIILPLDYAATIRDVMRHVGGHVYASRRRYANLVDTALTGLQDFPEKLADCDGSLMFEDNPAVK